MKKLLSLVLALLMALSAVTAVAEGKDTLVVTALTSSESFDPHGRQFRDGHAVHV